MTGIEVVQGVRNLFSDPNKWTQDSYARDENGLHVHYTHKGACSWCLLGGLNIVAGDNSEASQEAYKMVRDHISQPLHQFNDDYDTKYDDVMTALDEIIAMHKS